MNCAECKAEVPAGDDAIVCTGRGRKGAARLHAIQACTWISIADNRVVARGLCRKCAEAVACDGSACTRCGGLIRSAGERWMLVVDEASAGNVAGTKGRDHTDVIEYVARRRDRDGVARTLERGLCYVCASETRGAGEQANDLSGKLPPAALTVPFQRTAEASP